jgi:MoxR-like ATPase
VEQSGTYKLPEAQLDRFLIKTSLGYPDYQTSVNLLMDSANRARASKITAIIKPDAIRTMAALASDVFVDPSIMEYVTQLVMATRVDKDVSLGVSMRGALALARAVKTWAITAGRIYVTPDDVRDLAVAVLAHRVIVDPESDFAGVRAEEIIERVLVEVAPPAYRAA